MKVITWIKDVCERTYDAVFCWILDIYYFGLKPTLEFPEVTIVGVNDVGEELKAEEKTHA